MNKFKDNFTKVKDKKSAIILDELIQTSDNRKSEIKKPVIIKKGSSVYQKEFFNLISVIIPNRDHNWNQKFKVLCEEITRDNPELLSSLKIKYQFSNPKITNNG